MPRNVTITFADGTQKIYQNVPDSATPGTVIARANKDFPGQNIRTINGGKNPSTPAPKALAMTRQQAIQQTARDTIAERHAGGGFLSGLTDIGDAAVAGINSASFGLPNHIAAAARTYVPGLRNGNSYTDNIDLANEISHQQAARAPVTNILSNVAGSLATGRGELAAGKAILGKVAASGAPIVARAANFLQNAVPLSRATGVGARLANAGRVAATGATIGAAQAAGTGDNVGSGAALGAVGGAAVHGIGVAGGLVLRPVKDLLGRTNAAQYLKRFTTSTLQDIQQRADTWRQATGAEPTLFELLPLADRKSLISKGIAGRDSAVEQASNAIRERAANVGPEMADVVQGATGPERLATQRGMVQDLRTARGGQGPGDAALALRASQSPTDMQALRSQEARLIMAPHDNATVVNNFHDLLPQQPMTLPNGSIRMQESDPEISSAIRSVAGSLRQRPADSGFSVREVTDMISNLRNDANRGGIEGRNAGRAADYLLDTIDQNVPDAAAATQQMRNAFASRSRMAEGMQAGNAGTLRDEIQTGTSQRQAQTVRNAFDTPEGTLGRQLGQTNRLVSDLSNTPENALRSTIDLSRGGTPALAENLGQNAADRIQAAAQAQDQSAQALASASRMANSGSGEEPISGMALGHALVALSPHTFATTKLNAAQKILGMSFMPENRARTLVDMLFSQNPQMTDRAIAALNSSQQGARFLQTLTPSIMGASAATNAGSGSNIQSPDAAQAPQAPEQPAAPAMEDPTAQQPAVPDQTQVPGGMANLNGYTPMTQAAPVDPSQSQYMPALQHIYDNDSPDFLNFVESHQKQESGGKQFDKNGQPLRSKAGAYGIMQIMPDTAKAIAEKAGIPYDPIALQYDPAYNKLLGTVHVANLLDKYNGDRQKASAAYNAGEGAVSRATDQNGNLNLSALPQETQGYVPNVSG